MKILFAASENAWGGFLGMLKLRIPGHDFEATGGFHVPTLAGVDVLIPTMCRITRGVLETADRLKLIQQCGSGLEGVDIKAAAARGVPVANVPTGLSGNADSVAEIGVFLTIGLLRDTRGMAESLSRRLMGQPQGRALAGLTVGFVGLGGIGRALIDRLKPFKARLIGIRQSPPGIGDSFPELDWTGGPDDLPRLLGESDIVMLCVPATPRTHHLMNRETFRYMKPSSLIINLSRGAIIDRDALEHALESGLIAGAGLDVFWEEPPDPEDPIFRLNVLATPHIAGSTDVSMQGIVAGVAENITRVEQGLPPLNQPPA